MNEPEGKMTFYCPHCRQKLSFLDGAIIKMIGRLTADKFSCTVMFYIPAKLGEYGAIVAEGVELQEGARVEFECINNCCRRNFTSSYDENLAEIKMVDESGREFAVAFNKIYGKRSTFLLDIKHKKVVEAYGKDAPDYLADSRKPINFFGS